MNNKTYEDKIIERRIRYDKAFKNSPHSPLLEEQKKNFKEMSHFPIDERYRVVAKFEENSNHEEITILTSMGDERKYYRYGSFEFEFDEVKNKLTVFRPIDGDYFFLPFKDKTTGEESYKEGRYVELEKLSHGEIIVDFNTAYNPLCAYNDITNCTKVPKENILEITIPAGQKKFDNYMKS